MCIFWDQVKRNCALRTSSFSLLPMFVPLNFASFFLNGNSLVLGGSRYCRNIYWCFVDSTKYPTTHDLNNNCNSEPSWLCRDQEFFVWPVMICVAKVFQILNKWFIEHCVLLSSRFYLGYKFKWGWFYGLILFGGKIYGNQPNSFRSNHLLKASF